MAFPLPEKPSIAVLPFNNYSDDTDLDFLASGLTEDLTTSLSKVPALFVISRNSAAAYGGGAANVKRVAEELAVQYVLEGSVQKAGEELRINTQLIDALSGHHIWAERIDRPASDVFAVQDEIVKRVIVELQVELTEGVQAQIAARGTNNLDAWLLRVQALGELWKWTPEGHVRARELFNAAHETDPEWSRPIAGLAIIFWYEAKRGWTDTPEKSIRVGKQLAEQAITLNPDDVAGYQALANLYFLTNEPERAIAVIGSPKLGCKCRIEGMQ
jgi:TolB-like protein